MVVPTYNETPNIRPLCERLFRATRAAPADGSANASTNAFVWSDSATTSCAIASSHGATGAVTAPGSPSVKLVFSKPRNKSLHDTPEETV